MIFRVEKPAHTFSIHLSYIFLPYLIYILLYLCLYISTILSIYLVYAYLARYMWYIDLISSYLIS